MMTTFKVLLCTNCTDFDLSRMFSPPRGYLLRVFSKTCLQKPSIKLISSRVVSKNLFHHLKPVGQFNPDVAKVYMENLNTELMKTS